MKIPSTITTLLAGIVLTLISLWYGQNHGLLPVAASEQAAEIDGIFNLMMTIATGLFLLVQGIIIAAAIKFRRRKDDYTDGPPIEGNVPLEILWTAIPTIIVFFLAIYSFEVYNDMGGLDPMASMDHSGHQIAHHSEDASTPGASLLALGSETDLALGLGASPENQGTEASLVVDVMGFQYAWLFTYPGGVYTTEMHVPVNQDIQLNLTASDVLHAFWLPQFRIKQDVIPGRTVELRFTSNRVGEYPIVCAELCGAFHGAMQTKLFVETEEDYQNWFQSQQYALQDNSEQAVALNPIHRSDVEMLAPYAEEMGVNPTLIENLQTHHHSQSTVIR